MVALKSQTQKIDRLLVFLVVGLTLFGILMVYDASVVTAFRDFGDKYFYIRQQIFWAILGLGALFAASKFDYRRLEKLAPILMFMTFIALVLVLIPGLGVKVLGARRWLTFAGFSFQPAELTKLTFVLYLSFLFAKKPKFLPFLVSLGILSILIMLEPDLGTTVVLVASGLSLYFVSGAPLFSLVLMAVLGILTGLSLIFSSNYRKERFLTFLDISRDPLGASYHIRQVLLALGAGGLWGLGLGASRQKYEYLPEAMTDSIFAIIAEELGFIGAIVLLIVFLVIVFKGLKISQEAPDRFGQLLAVGITSWIGVQTLVNLASQVALVPLTGVPLPFISYGGSSLVVALSGIGILLNISKQRVKKK
ncbi:MAG: putative lipid II flippase FtsW [Patescibacteria group bacterium]